MRLIPYRREVSWRARAADAAIGALGVLGLAPFQIWPATVLSFALLFIRLSTHARDTPHEPWRGTATGFWTGIGYFAAGMFWIASAFFERGPEYIPLIIPLVFGLFVLLSIFWGWAGRAFVMIRPRPLFAPLLFASLWFIAEFTRGHLFGGFPWNLPGYAWEAGTALSQLASVVGVYGLSFILFVVAGGLGQAWLSRAHVRSAALHGGLALAVMAAMFAHGWMRMESFDLDSASGTTVPDTRLRLVHVPFRQSEMMDRRQAVTITDDYFRQTFSQPLSGVTHVVWPEGAVRGVAMDDLAFLSVLPEVVRNPANGGAEDAEVPAFLFSSIRLEAGPKDSVPTSGGRAIGPNGERAFNSAVAVHYPDGYPAIANVSDKYRLVPMGEVVPLEGLLSKVGFSAIARSFTPAPDKSNRRFPGLPRASVQICYEVLFPGLTEPGAQLILNQSNDAWFGRTTGPAQHEATARMRALEEGVPMVRVAANGWSGTVDALGRWDVRMDPRTTGIRDVAIPAQTRSTPFSRLTHIILLLISLSASVCIIVAGRVSTRGAADMANEGDWSTPARDH